VCTVDVGKGMTRLGPDEVQKFAARLPPASSPARSGRP
jgi:hypothetical protein